MYKKNIDFKTNKEGCFICISHKLVGGYPMIRRDNKRVGIHRYVYEECFGEIPKGMIVRHKCDNPSCINPEHLVLGTHQDNMNDRVERNRNRNQLGENNNMSKLTREEVNKIREEYIPRKITQEMLAQKYNVKKRTIQAIVRRENWK